MQSAWISDLLRVATRDELASLIRRALSDPLQEDGSSWPTDESDRRIVAALEDASRVSADRLSVDRGERLLLVDALSAALSAEVLDSIRGYRAHQRLAAAGLLPYLPTTIRWADRARMSFGQIITDEHVLSAMNSPLLKQQWDLSPNDPSSKSLVLFVGRLAVELQKPLLLLVQVSIENAETIVQHVWRLPQKDFYASNAATVEQAFEVFLRKYGMRQRVDGRDHGLLVLDRTLLHSDSNAWLTKFSVPYEPGAHVFSIRVVRPTDVDVTHVSIAYTVNLSRYLRDRAVFPEGPQSPPGLK